MVYLTRGGEGGRGEGMDSAQPESCHARGDTLSVLCCSWGVPSSLRTSIADSRRSLRCTRTLGPPCRLHKGGDRINLHSDRRPRPCIAQDQRSTRGRWCPCCRRYRENRRDPKTTVGLGTTRRTATYLAAVPASHLRRSSAAGPRRDGSRMFDSKVRRRRDNLRGV